MRRLLRERRRHHRMASVEQHFISRRTIRIEMLVDQALKRARHGAGLLQLVKALHQLAALVDECDHRLRGREAGKKHAGRIVGEKCLPFFRRIIDVGKAEDAACKIA